MKILHLFYVAILIWLVSCSSNNAKKVAEKKKIKVFFLAGQSNMDGRARAYHLSDADKKRLQKASKNVTLYYNHRKPVPLQTTVPEAHIQQKFNAKRLFGPELFFGIHVSEKYPKDKIILIKRSKGGMSLYGAWNPHWTLEKATAMKEENEPKLYSDFINYAKEVLKNFNKDTYEIEGMLWVQGESDSGKKKYGTIPADTYQENLKELIKGVRTTFNKPKLPFLIFQVGRGNVVKAMKNIANSDDFVSLIPQSQDKNSDDFYERNPPPLGHYKYKAMKKIGRKFYEYYQNKYSKLK